MSANVSPMTQMKDEKSFLNLVPMDVSAINATTIANNLSFANSAVQKIDAPTMTEQSSSNWIQVNLEVKISNSEQILEDFNYQASHILEQVTIKRND